VTPGGRANHDGACEDVVGILLTQGAWTSPTPPAVWVDFWTSVYQAIRRLSLAPRSGPRLISGRSDGV
jgi:hypothetical protein